MLADTSVPAAARVREVLAEVGVCQLAAASGVHVGAINRMEAEWPAACANERVQELLTAAIAMISGAVRSVVLDGYTLRVTAIALTISAIAS